VNIYEGIVEQDQIRLVDHFHLAENMKVYIVVPEIPGNTQLESALSKLDSSSLHTGKTFETFSLREGEVSREASRSLRAAFEFAKRYASEPRGWLLLSGDPGLGKTHLAAAIANHQLKQNAPVLFVSVLSLFDCLRAAFATHAYAAVIQILDKTNSAPLLILDDLTTKSASPWLIDKLYQILDYRYTKQLPTVLIMSLLPDDLDPRLRSRLSDLELVRKFKILAPDHRHPLSGQGNSPINSLDSYLDKTFERFEIRPDLSREEQSNLQQALNLARDFAQAPQDWLMFTGGYGVGKTHLAAAIANHQIASERNALFVFVPDMLDHLRSTFDRSSNSSFEQIFEEVRTAPLLVLDDLGTESATPWAREKLYQIINYRYVAKLPTVITTSVSPDDLDPRIRTRILDETRCLVFPIIAPSYRSGHSTRPISPKSVRTTRSKR
jgi:DNA replication protein DnaC